MTPTTVEEQAQAYAERKKIHLRDIMDYAQVEWAFIAGMEARNTWIAVGERLPDENKAIQFSGNKYVIVGSYNGTYFISSHGIKYVAPTHWRYLNTEPPK